MANLQFYHQISEKRKSGTVNQTMIIEVDYDPHEDGIDEVEVHVYQDGIHIAEISKLLDKAEGQPLLAMIEAIDWREMYHDKKAAKKEQYREEEA